MLLGNAVAFLLEFLVAAHLRVGLHLRDHGLLTRQFILNCRQFFFGNLTGGQTVDASWELVNSGTGIGIRETGSFKTNKINLWGWKQVISPELFFSIRVEPGKELEWSRTYTIFETK